jgi:hypothetical protein
MILGNGGAGRCNRRALRGQYCAGFSVPGNTERFPRDLQERLQSFGLELHPEKTRLIGFGRYDAERLAERGEGKPETFNFPGFTRIGGKNHKTVISRWAESRSASG